MQYIVTHAVHPHLVVIFYPVKVGPLKLEPQNHTKNISVVLQNSPIQSQFEEISQGVHELLSDIHTVK